MATARQQFHADPLEATIVAAEYLPSDDGQRVKSPFRTTNDRVPAGKIPAASDKHTQLESNNFIRTSCTAHK